LEAFPIAAYPRLHWCKEDSFIRSLPLITENAPEPFPIRILHVSFVLLLTTLYINTKKGDYPMRLISRMARNSIKANTEKMVSRLPPAFKQAAKA
jgi:hypothetical protein